MDCSPPGSSVHGIFSGSNTGVGCHFLLQGIFLTQGSNLHLLPWQVDSFLLSHQGSPIPGFSWRLIFSPAFFHRPYSEERGFWCPFCQNDGDLWEDGPIAVICDGFHMDGWFHPSIHPWERILMKSLGPKRLEPRSTEALKSELSYHIHTSETHQRVKDRHDEVRAQRGSGKNGDR